MKEKIEERYNNLINLNFEDRISNLFKTDEYIRTNIFLTIFKYPLKKERQISKLYPIFLRNPKNNEAESIGKKLRAKILKILNSIEDLTLILDETKFSEKLSLKDFDISDIIIYSRIIENFVSLNNKEDLKRLLEEGKLNSYNLSLFIIEDYLKELIIIEIKDWQSIDNFLAIYYDIKNIDEIEARDYRNYFIEDFMNLFNKVNFSQKVITGLGPSKNDLSFLHDASDLNNKDMSEVINVLEKPIIVDNFINTKSDHLSFQFIIETLNSTKLRTYRNRCITYVTILEFMLTKPKKYSNNKSISFQFYNNITKCYDYLNRKISKRELKLIYEYRSSILHGDFENVRKCLEQLINLPPLKKHIQNVKYIYSELDFDNLYYEEILSIRLNEIFRTVYSLFCTNPQVVQNIKNNN